MKYKLAVASYKVRIEKYKLTILKNEDRIVRYKVKTARNKVRICKIRSLNSDFLLSIASLYLAILILFFSELSDINSQLRVIKVQFLMGKKTDMFSKLQIYF